MPKICYNLKKDRKNEADINLLRGVYIRLILETDFLLKFKKKGKFFLGKYIIISTSIIFVKLIHIQFLLVGKHSFQMAS